MAKVKNNIVTQGLSGSLGNQIVFRKDKAGRTIVAAKPTFPDNRTFNTGQLAQQEAFRQAINYARTAKSNEIYINRAQGTPMNAYNVAVADWFGQPEVLELDISGWTGQIGQTIRVKAQDDTKVVSVRVMIRENNATAIALEQGEAVQSETDGLLWTYTTTTVVPMTPGTRLDAFAQDLPGNIGGNSMELN